jgi:CheY-like chemotaxis protein
MKIFVVDDEPAIRLIARDHLEQLGHEVDECADGPALLAAMAAPPDIVLLDIEMPGMSGIEACSALRAAGHDQVPVIFVSSHDDLDSRLAAYEAGGNDFIVKPYYIEELAQKLKLAEHQQSHRSALSEQAQFAQRTAFAAMSSLGEMGVVLQFLRDSFACNTPEQLAAQVIGAVGQYGLHCLVRIGQGAGAQDHDSQGEPTPLDGAILDHMAGMDRIFQFHDRLALNYPGITILVLGLPLDDPERIGRLRDHLAMVAEGAAARLQALESEMRCRVQGSGIRQAVAQLTQTLVAVEQGREKLRARSREIDEEHLEELIEAFVHLGLTEVQENFLAEMAEQTHMRLGALHEDDKVLGTSLRSIADELNKLTGA